MKPPSQRLLYLDWVRGIAALVMLQGHVFQSFFRNDQRESGPYLMSQFVGGMPPAVFLFLLGVTFAFLMDSQERKGVNTAGRWSAAALRSSYLFAVAFLFRLQLWAFSFGKSPATDLLRVDILNAMGLALLVFSVMAAFRTEERVRLCAILGLAVASASPLVSNLDWTGVPVVVQNYIKPSHDFFGFFPWAAFVAFGMSAGSILRILKSENVATAMQWFAWGGIAVAFSAWTISDMPVSVYSNSDFWLNSPALILIKLGVVLMTIAFAWIWTLNASTSWSWVRQFGMTSLLVYWVHIELVYGSWFGSLKGTLGLGETIFAAILTVIAMLGLSLLRTNGNAVWAWATRTFSAPRVPDRVSGD